MMRNMLDAYLDGELQASEKAALEQSLATDTALAALLAKIKGERALRQAAFATYQPAAGEAAQFAARFLAAARRSGPVGYVGPWIRQAAAVAAVLVLVGGGFAAGRMSGTGRGSPVAQGVKPDAAVIYRVMYVDPNGDLQVPEFSSVDEANEFIARHDLRRTDTQVASVDLSHPGSF
jgi:anti-sigma factor RsiW